MLRKYGQSVRPEGIWIIYTFMDAAVLQAVVGSPRTRRYGDASVSDFVRPLVFGSTKSELRRATTVDMGTATGRPATSLTLFGATSLHMQKNKCARDTEGLLALASGATA